jgi:TrmH family RNA methyltransferase
MDPIISSRTNSKVKLARALKGRKARQEKGLFLVEGIRHVGDAVEAGSAIQALYYAPDLLESEFAQNLVTKASDAGVPCYATTAEVFHSIAEKEHPQGILAVVCKPQLTLQEFNKENFPWVVALLSPQDPGNLGTILRTIDAVGASGLILLESSVDAYHPSAIRAGMGAHFWHPVLSASFDEFSNWVRMNGYHVYGTSAHGESVNSSVVIYERPAILLMGSERQGLSAEQAALCDSLIRLPMHGRVSSLNLAVATGIMLYEMLAKGLAG